jgi:Domain of unknown function (DUF1995)
VSFCYRLLLELGTVRDRNQQVVQAVKAALASPRIPSYRLIECEFPAVASLNKQGDGSLRSATEVDDANLVTAKLLLQSLSPLVPGLGPAVWLLTSSAASNTFQRKADRIGRSFSHSLRNGLPAVKSRDVCVLVAPCNSQDYSMAQQLVVNGNSVVLLNGFAKDPKSVSGDATMAYFLKPLTYNSNIAGYFIRSYPGPWTVVDVSTKAAVLGTFYDSEIMVPGTNTPDLRPAGRLVQKAVDERAIQARRTLQQ